MREIDRLFAVQLLTYAIRSDGDAVNRAFTSRVPNSDFLSNLVSYYLFVSISLILMRPVFLIVTDFSELKVRVTMGRVGFSGKNFRWVRLSWFIYCLRWVGSSREIWTHGSLRCPCIGSSGEVSPVSTVSGPNRPSPIQFDDVDVPDITPDLTAAIQSTYGGRQLSDPGRPKVTPSQQGHPAQGQGRNILEELTDRLQQPDRKSRDAVTSSGRDVTKLRVFGVDAGRHDDSVRSASDYPLLVINLHMFTYSCW